MKPKSWWDERPGESWLSRREIAATLESNERAFSLLFEVEQEVMRECKTEWLHSSGDWRAGDRIGAKNYTYRVCSDFVPEYAPEPEKPFDPNYAPPGYVAVKDGDCLDCD